jgi:hypothetical protein
MLSKSADDEPRLRVKPRTPSTSDGDLADLGGFRGPAEWQWGDDLAVTAIRDFDLQIIRICK